MIKQILFLFILLLQIVKISIFISDLNILFFIVIEVVILAYFDQISAILLLNKLIQLLRSLCYVSLDSLFRTQSFWNYIYYTQLIKFDQLIRPFYVLIFDTCHHIVSLEIILKKVTTLSIVLDGNLPIQVLLASFLVLIKIKYRLCFKL